MAQTFAPEDYRPTKASLTTPGGRVSPGRWRFSLSSLPVLILGALVVGIAIVPLIYTIDSAFYGETKIGLSDERSLDAIINVYTTARYLGYLAQALILAALVTTLSLVLGVTMAFIIARTDLAGKPLLDLMVIMPLFLSPFTGLIAWVVLGSVKTGFINVAIQGMAGVFGMEVSPLVNIWSYAGVVWVMTLFFTPFSYLFTVNNLRSMDGSLEEAARTSGATAMQTIFRITLPMMLPSIFASGLLIFILAAELYTIPGIIGVTAGFTTLPYQIYLDSTAFPVQRAHAAAAGTILLWVMIIGIYFQRRITSRSEKYVTIGGKGHRSRPLKLGGWAWPAGGLIWTYVFCAVILPTGALALFSLMKYSSVNFSWDLFTTDHYVNLFTIGNTQQALKNTMILGLLSGGICLLMGFLISYFEIRRPGPLAKTVAFLGVLPVAVPGVVYGIGLLWTYLRSPLYGTIWILLLAYIAKYLPYAIVVSRTSILQLNRELEESARMSGARPFVVLRAITMPILKPALVAIFFFVMLKSIMELSASILLYSERGPVLSVLTWSYMETGNFQFAAAIGVVQSLMLVGLVFATRYLFRVRLEATIGKAD